MQTHDGALEDALRRAVSLDAEALTFFSGVGAFVTTPAGQQPLPMAQPLSARRVRQLHEACLAVAGRNDLRWLHYCRYRVDFPSTGRFLCEYVERRGTSNLQLRRDPEAPECVETRRAPRLPLRAARTVPRREPRFDEELASFAHEHASADEPGDAASSS